jgi:RNA polymerase primary sigma factor
MLRLCIFFINYSFTEGKIVLLLAKGIDNARHRVYLSPVCPVLSFRKSSRITELCCEPYPIHRQRTTNMRQLKITKSITNRESQSLEKYLQEIGKVELISPDEEVQLARRIKDGDQAALERLTKANLRFVVSVAKQYQNQGLSLSDLINEGNLGLIKAAQRFDETRGFKFISYAVWWIRQSILQSLAEQSRIVRLPLNKVGSLNKINKAFSELEQRYEREPSPEELAEALDLGQEEVRTTMGVAARHVSMDAPFEQGEDNSLLDVLTSDDVRTDNEVAYKASLCKEVERSLGTLTERQREVLVLYFGIGMEQCMSLEDIGDRFQLTRERVRQIKDKAINKLRAQNRSKLLKSYLGN